METTSTININRPADEVFAYVADMENNPDWQRGMKRCTWTTPPPLGVGSRYDQLASFLGRTIISRFEVVEFDPGRSIRIKTYESTFPLDITRTVEPLTDSSCRVVANVSGEETGMFKLLGPLMRPMVSASVRRDYRTLKEHLETGER